MLLRPVFKPFSAHHAVMPTKFATASSKKQLILNIFAMQSPGHLNHGLIKYPTDKGSQYNNNTHWQVRSCQIPRHLLRRPPRRLRCLQRPCGPRAHDLLYSIPAMAAVTESIGFGVTASTTYEQPYAMARESSTVESIEQWTSGLEYRDLLPRLRSAKLWARYTSRARRAVRHRARISRRYVQAVGRVFGEIITP